MTRQPSFTQLPSVDSIIKDSTFTTYSNRTVSCDEFNLKLAYLIKRMLVGLRIKHFLNGSAIRVQDTRRLIDGNEIGVGRRGVGAGDGHDVL